MFGLFKNKKAEKPLEELTNEELLDLMSEFTDRGNKATILLEKRRENLHRLYSLIYQEVDSKLFSSALEHISQYVNLSESYGELVREPVFILFLASTEGGGGSPEDVFSVYDSIISYYKNKGAEDYVELFEKKRADYEITVNEIKDLELRYGFILNSDLVIAIQSLERLAVYKYLSSNELRDTFTNVWTTVLKEVEYFENADSRNNLNKTTYKGAKNWLKRFVYLCGEDVPDEYKEE